MARPTMFRNWPKTFPLYEAAESPDGTLCACVEGVYDGDTYSQWTYFRDGVIAWDRIRVADCYAPELHEPGGGLSLKIAWDILQPPGGIQPVRLVAAQLYQSFDRWVAVSVLEGGRTLGDALIAAGAAQRERPEGRATAESRPHPDAPPFTSYQAAADHASAVDAGVERPAWHFEVEKNS